MEANIIIAAGYPHELLGLLRRMPGIDDLNFLQDSNGFAQAFEANYPEKSEYIKVISIACNLGVIAEMSSIINEPMWRKRSFINKSIIQLTAENRMKEYQACEILESFMQIFGWEFEVKVARRWEVTEEDSSEYHKSKNETYVAKENVDKTKNKTNEINNTEEPNETVNDEEDDETVNSQEASYRSEIQAKTNVRTAVKSYETQLDAQTDVQMYSQAGSQSQSQSQGQTDTNSGGYTQGQKKNIKKQTGNRKGVSHTSKKSETHANENKQYADDDKIYDMNAYIQNEILSGGIRFENLMTNAVRKDVANAVRGNSEAQYRMGKYYSESNTKHTDYEEALKWYRVSASQGNKKAQFELGMLYDGGKVKCKDYKKQAMKCYMGLAESGFPTAQCMVGMKYKFGDGVEEDINEAIKWFKKAAVQGHTDAQRNLGDTYMAIGKKNEAMKWYERAAAAGDVYCEKMLGNR